VISTFPNDEITMIDSSSDVKAQPGALNSTGNGFAVSWERQLLAPAPTHVTSDLCHQIRVG
jgi:hypothetical protein